MSFKHIAISLAGADYDFSVEKKLSLDSLYSRRSWIIMEILALVFESKIPIVTIHLLPSGAMAREEFEPAIDSMEEFFALLKDDESIHSHQAKVSVLGKWYDLPSRLVESIKAVVDSTKDYDKFFLNFCVNYDGQGELVDACRIISMKVKADKLDTESITADTLKENLYTSYFIPPELIIVTGEEKKPYGFLLWDSASSKFHFTGRHWSEFSAEELRKVLQ